MYKAVSTFWSIYDSTCIITWRPADN